MKKVKEYKIVNEKSQKTFEEELNSCLADGWKILKVETVAVRVREVNVNNDITRFIAHLIRNKKVG